MRFAAVRLFILAATLGTSVALATPRLPFRHFRTDEGLPQSQVLALLQDSRGELWVGTWNGAARFDGADFRYLALRAGLPKAMVFDIVESAEGDLYFAAGRAIARLGEDRTSIVKVFSPEVSDSEGNWLRDLYLDRQGVLWAGAQSGGVAFLDQGTLTTVRTPDLVADVLQVFAETAAGELLLGTSEGIFVIEDDRVRRWHEEEGPWNRPVGMLAGSGDGGLLMAGPDRLWRLETQGAKTDAGQVTEIVAVAELTSDGAPIARARSALVDRHGDLWVATESGVYRALDERIVRLGRQEGLSGEGRFYSLLEDREGNVWIGSDDGLSLHPGDLFRIYPTDEEIYESVWSLGLDRADRLIVGTRSSGAFRFDGEGLVPLPGPNPLPGKRVRAIVADLEGNLWFGTHNDGLFRWDGATWREFLPPEIPSPRIYGAFRDRRGKLWFATRRGVLSRDEKGFHIWTSKEGLPSDLIQAIREDDRGRIVAATSLGLARLEDGRFSVPPEFEILAGIPVRSLVTRRDGSLWVGTEGLGLYAWVDGDWVVYRAGESLPGHRGGPSDDFSWGLIEDAGERLWLATNHGLDLFDGESWTHFSERDGLMRHELASNAILATPDGAAWFGFPGGGGLVRFPAETPPSPEPLPIVRITSVVTADREIFQEPFDLELPWSERDVEFSFIAIRFRDEDRVVYRTMLERYDSDYSLPRAERTVRYTNLGPGPYRFLVLAAGADGRWTREPAEVRIVILPPFYRTWWFYLLSATAAAVAVVSVHRLRLRAIASEKRILETKVEDRTRELTEEKKKLETALAHVRTLSGLLPICASCNKIRDETGEWKQLELYIEHHSEASFSHSICPVCARDLYPDLYKDQR